MLAISGAPFVISIIAMYSGNELGKYLSIGFFGMVLFGIGGKIAHYKFRDPNINGNINAWFPGWRHSTLADSFAVFGISLMILCIVLFIMKIV
ncbi:hypothetical protein SAMN05421690_10691 [Nitrosomonas sp. Nm51]|nr:hypothetical protein SAMN05421690_10691 [Nitrosomonas sp. Nm51]